VQLVNTWISKASATQRAGNDDDFYTYNAEFIIRMNIHPHVCSYLYVYYSIKKNCTFIFHISHFIFKFLFPIYSHFFTYHHFHIYVNVYIYIFIYSYIYIIYIYIYLYICIHVHVCIYIHIYVYIYIFVFIYIHIYTHLFLGCTDRVRPGYIVKNL
jgi:hypothetical protein